MTRPIMPSEGLRPEAIRPSRAGESAPAQSSEVQPVRPVDRVEISTQGRALSEEAVVTGPGQLQPSTVSLAEIRQRIIQGHYDSEAMAESVARRLLQSGDL